MPRNPNSGGGDSGRARPASTPKAPSFSCEAAKSAGDEVLKFHLSECKTCRDEAADLLAGGNRGGENKLQGFWEIALDELKKIFSAPPKKEEKEKDDKGAKK